MSVDDSPVCDTSGEQRRPAGDKLGCQPFDGLEALVFHDRADKLLQLREIGLPAGFDRSDGALRLDGPAPFGAFVETRQ